uniref:Uncharacterized protein n=1 Tax=Setaria viridis TaxID=4556 RepID=A0A4U6V508_SETVI|nr:hypothetical protein SEVIR_3G033800v2 [Setaria viridis]
MQSLSSRLSTSELFYNQLERPNFSSYSPIPRLSVSEISDDHVGGSREEGEKESYSETTQPIGDRSLYRWFGFNQNHGYFMNKELPPSSQRENSIIKNNTVPVAPDAPAANQNKFPEDEEVPQLFEDVQCGAYLCKSTPETEDKQSKETDHKHQDGCICSWISVLGATSIPTRFWS